MKHFFPYAAITFSVAAFIITLSIVTQGSSIAAPASEGTSPAIAPQYSIDKTNIKRLKLEVLTINVIIVSVATAFTGVISFVGLIVPHILRMMGGSDNRYLLLNGILMGGIVLTLADLVARMTLRPAELPIGIVTSVVGVPVFIFLLRKGKFYF